MENARHLTELQGHARRLVHSGQMGVATLAIQTHVANGADLLFTLQFGYGSPGERRIPHPNNVLVLFAYECKYVHLESPLLSIATIKRLITKCVITNKWQGSFDVMYF